MCLVVAASIFPRIKRCMSVVVVVQGYRPPCVAIASPVPSLVPDVLDAAPLLSLSRSLVLATVQCPVLRLSSHVFGESGGGRGELERLPLNAPAQTHTYAVLCVFSRICM